MNTIALPIAAPLIAVAIIAAPAAANPTRAEQMLSRPMRRRARDEMPSAGDFLSVIKRVNRAVNDLPLTDCKASAFEKHRRLLNAGVKSVPIVVTTETGGYHMIVVVGEYALDNREDFVVTIEDLRAKGYRIAALH